MHSHKAVLTVLALQVLVFSFLLPLPTVAQVAGGTISGTITPTAGGSGATVLLSGAAGATVAAYRARS